MTSGTNNLVTHRMLLGCYNASGQPDMFPCRVSCPEGLVDSHGFYDAARADAEAQDYDAPFVIYDCEVDEVGKKMAPLYDWTDTSLVTVVEEEEPQGDPQV